MLFGFRTLEALDFLRAEDGQTPALLPEDGQLRLEEANGLPDEYEDVDDAPFAHPVTTRSRRQSNPPDAPDAPDDPTNPSTRPATPAVLADMTEYRPCHIDAKDAIAFAAVRMKQYYDRKHKPAFFVVGDFVNLRLHRGFSVPGIAH